MNTALLVVILLVVLADLYLDLRVALPKQRRASERENAARAVAAAEQRGGSASDKARYATQALMHNFPRMKAPHAAALVEHAVSERK